MRNFFSLIGAALLSGVLPIQAGECIIRSYGGGYSCPVQNYSYPAPSYSAPTYSKSYKATEYHDYDDTPVVEYEHGYKIIVQHNLAPAYAFQILYPFAGPDGRTAAGGAIVSQGAESSTSSAPTPAASPLALQEQPTGLASASNASGNEKAGITAPPSLAAPQSPAQSPPGLLSEEQEARIAQRVALLLRKPSLAEEEDELPPLESSEQAPPPVQKLPDLAKGREGVNASEPINLDSLIIPALQSSCIRCHSAKVAKGDIQLFDEAGQWKPLNKLNNSPVSKEEIVEAIASGRMPKDARSDPSKAFPRNLAALLPSWQRSP